MEDCNIVTQVNDLTLWAGTDLATTSYTVSIASTTVEPVASATRAILDMAQHAGQGTSGNLLKCIPVLVGANNAVITGVRIYGWASYKSQATNVREWWPSLICELAMVAGNIPGPSDGPGSSYFAMDTITYINPATEPAWMNVFSPVSVTADMPGWFRFDTQGYRKLEIVVDLGANATGFNCYVSKY